MTVEQHRPFSSNESDGRTHLWKKVESKHPPAEELMKRGKNAETDIRSTKRGTAKDAAEVRLRAGKHRGEKEVK